MTEREWAEIIGINRECFETIVKNRRPDFGKLGRIFWEDEILFSDIMKSGDFSHSEILSFLFYHCFEYRINSDDPDIAAGIFDDGMQDIMIWAEDCFGHHGYYGISEERYGWIANLLKKAVVRLGRLEFEPSVMKENVKIGNREISENSKIINVHIPAGLPLVYEECLASYRKCLDYYGLDKAVFQCESWLLSPLLDEMLPNTSNILKFRKDYHIFRTDIMERLFEERIFGCIIYDDPNKYSAVSGLQKKAKEMLRKGIPLVGAWGLCFSEELGL